MVKAYRKSWVRVTYSYCTARSYKWTIRHSLSVFFRSRQKTIYIRIDLSTLKNADGWAPPQTYWIILCHTEAQASVFYTTSKAYAEERHSRLPQCCWQCLTCRCSSVCAGVSNRLGEQHPAASLCATWPVSAKVRKILKISLRWIYSLWCTVAIQPLSHIPLWIFSHLIQAKSQRHGKEEQETRR